MAVRKYSLAEDGISEAIGFILIFTIVIAGIGLVTLYGYPMLLQQQTGANERIMEKNMIVLQNDVKSLAYKTVPYKESSLKVEGGSLTVYNTLSTPPVATFSVTDCVGGNYVDPFPSGDLRYSSLSAGAEISLQNGAVVTRRLNEPGSVMLAEPRWFYDAPTNTVVLNLIGFNSTDVMSRAGIGTVQIAMGDTDYKTYPITGDLCIKYDSNLDYSDAWENYFRNSLKMTGTGPEYRFPLDASKPATLVIKKFDVTIKSL